MTLGPFISSSDWPTMIYLLTVRGCSVLQLNLNGGVDTSQRVCSHLAHRSMNEECRRERYSTAVT